MSLLTFVASRLLWGLLLCGSDEVLLLAEVLEIVDVEVFDVGGFSGDILPGHADIDVGAVREELRGFCGVAYDE